jgi:hypothetical protein
MAGRIKNPGNFVMLLPRALDPVEAGRDMPLPPERPSSFNLSATTMEDPTAVDVPLPEPRPTVEPAPKSAAATAAAAAPKRKPRAKP